MKYRGYTGSVEYDADDNILHGRVLGIAGVVAYEGTSLAELETDFRNGVDGYLETCAANGIEPAKPFNGKMLVRVTSDLHERAHAEAAARGMSLNRFLTSLLDEATLPRGAKIAHK